MMICKPPLTTPTFGFPRPYDTFGESIISHSFKLVFEHFEKRVWIYTAYNVDALQI